MYRIHRLKDLKFESLVVKQKEFKFSDRPEVSHKIKKLWFFIRYEGFVKTFRKIKSKKNKALKLSYYLTVLTVKYNKKTFLNFSIQTSQKQDCFVIENIFFESNSFDNKIDIFTSKREIFNQFSNTNNRIYKNYIHLDEIPQQPENHSSKKGVFIYGLGDYSRVFIAAFLKKQHKICCTDYNYQLAEYYKNRYSYDKFALVPQETYSILKRVENPLAIIATYHSDHTRIAKEIFEVNPNTKIFIEKPPTVTLLDLKNLIALYKKNAKIDIGYNRRYIPVNQEIKDKIKGQQVIINISVKEILINDNHWYFWDNQGTRITGNLTHWIDLATFWIDEMPIELNVISSDSIDETISVAILYSKGSLVNISVSDKGNVIRGVQEKIEIRTKDKTLFIDDYLKFSSTKKNGYTHTRTFLKRIKGHEKMYKHVMNWYEEKESSFYSTKDLIYTSLLTFYISKMFKENIRTLRIEEIVKEYFSEL